MTEYLKKFIGKRMVGFEYDDSIECDNESLRLIFEDESIMHLIGSGSIDGTTGFLDFVESA